LGEPGLILLFFSQDYLITEMNGKAESTFQWVREDTLNKNFFEVVLPQQDWQEVSSDIKELMNTQASVDIETQTILKDENNHSFL